jgi:hypothetical protein
VKRAAVVLVVVFVASACATEAGTPSTTAPATTVAGATTTTSGSGADLIETMTAFSGFVRSWNENQMDWMVAFQDPAVGYEEFLRVQSEVQRAQSALVAGMSLEVAGLSPELQEAFQPIVDHYEDRVRLLRPLFAAAATGTSEQFDSALIAYQDHVATGIDVIEAVLDHPVVEAAAAAEGLSVDDLMDALRSAVGG